MKLFNRKKKQEKSKEDRVQMETMLELSRQVEELVEVVGSLDMNVVILTSALNEVVSWRKL